MSDVEKGAVAKANSKEDLSQMRGLLFPLRACRLGFYWIAGRFGNKENERGAVLAEFAIVTTVLLTMIFGIIDFGRALYTYHVVSNAARLGTRYAIVRGSSCTAAGCPATATSIQTYVRGQSPGITQSAMTVSTTWSTQPGCSDPLHQGPGCLVTVQVSYAFQFFMPGVPSASMTSTAQSVISQ